MDDASEDVYELVDDHAYAEPLPAHLPGSRDQRRVTWYGLRPSCDVVDRRVTLPGRTLLLVDERHVTGNDVTDFEEVQTLETTMQWCNNHPCRPCNARSPRGPGPLVPVSYTHLTLPTILRV